MSWSKNIVFNAQCKMGPNGRKIQTFVEWSVLSSYLYLPATCLIKSILEVLTHFVLGPLGRFELRLKYIFLLASRHRASLAPKPDHRMNAGSSWVDRKGRSF